jgi:predicted nucleotidyltransferase
MSSDRFGLNSDVIERINSIFRKSQAIHEVIIYGSRAKGTYKTGSDIDLTIVGSELGAGDLLKLELELDDLSLPYKIDLSLLHQIEQADLLEHIQRVGQVFYRKEAV